MLVITIVKVNAKRYDLKYLLRLKDIEEFYKATICFLNNRNLNRKDIDVSALLPDWE